MNPLAADHAVCAELLRRSGSSFALPIRLLPPAKRRGTTALYAFCRRADDIVDDATDSATARRDLDAFADQLHGALRGAGSGDPVIRALVDTTRRYAIPEHYLHEILAGVRMDLEHPSYATFAELEEYCRRVASAVGLAAIHVWGFRTPEALVAGHACGMAFQLTNILRDISEDLGRGRIYLPREDCVACGCSVDALRKGMIGGEFSRLAALEVGRAERFFTAAQPLDGMLSTDGRLVFRAMFGVYGALLGAVRRAGTSIFSQRIRPPKPLLVAAALATLATGPKGIRLPL